MSWGRFNGVTPLFRVALTIDSSASAVAGDVEIQIPSTLTHFWKTIDASGAQLRVTASDGESVLVYQLKAGFSTTTRTGYIQIDDFTPAEAAVFQIWLYYGMDGASSGATAFVYAASKSGYAYLGAPQFAVRGTPQRPGDITPREVWSKASTEQRWIWFDLAPLLQTRFTSADGYPQYEELHSVVYDVQTGTASQPAMLDAASPRFIEGRYVQVLVKAGSSGTDYVVILTVKTRVPLLTAAQVIQVRTLLKVRDVQE